MDERVKVQMLQGRVQQMEADIEAIPILKAQVHIRTELSELSKLFTSSTTRSKCIKQTSMQRELPGKRLPVRKQTWRRRSERSSNDRIN